MNEPETACACTDATTRPPSAPTSPTARSRARSRGSTWSRTKPDVILGGGEDFWFPPGEPGRAGPTTRRRTRPSRARAPGQPRRARGAAGYEYVPRATGCGRSRGRKVLGLFANEEMFEHRDEGQGDLYEPVVPLQEMAPKALGIAVARPRRLLPADRGGGDRRDGARQQRRADHQVTAQALDRTVELALDFAAHATRHAGGRDRRPRDRRPGDRERRRRRRVRRRSSPREDGPFAVAGTDLEFSVDWTTGGHTGAEHAGDRQRARRRALRPRPEQHRRARRDPEAMRLEGAS